MIDYPTNNTLKAFFLYSVPLNLSFLLAKFTYRDLRPDMYILNHVTKRKLWRFSRHPASANPFQPYCIDSAFIIIRLFCLIFWKCNILRPESVIMCRRRIQGLIYSSIQYGYGHARSRFKSVAVPTLFKYDVLVDIPLQRTLFSHTVVSALS